MLILLNINYKIIALSANQTFQNKRLVDKWYDRSGVVLKTFKRMGFLSSDFIYTVTVLIGQKLECVTKAKWGKTWTRIKFKTLLYVTRINLIFYCFLVFLTQYCNMISQHVCKIQTTERCIRIKKNNWFLLFFGGSY